jgi:1-acyl-sn-glycerol-3-phosphate acyltransferase
VTDASTTELPTGIGSLQRPVGWVMKPLFRFLWKFDVQGLNNLPSSGGAVICANHLSAIDSFVVPAVLPRPIMYVGKSEYLDDWKTAMLFPKLGMIPIDRRGGDHAAAALDVARTVLETGGLFGIYPEGTRSRSGRLHRGHTGAARLAIETGAPIVPVGLVGTVGIQPPDQTMPNLFRRASIRFGSPIDVTRYRRRIGDRVLYRELIDEVMFEIAALSGQEYDDTYAGSTGHAATSTEPIAEPTIARRSSAEVLRTRPLVAA